MTPEHVRPTYHLTPRQGWLNDPLGVTFRDGRVDLFYQAVPQGIGWMPGCHWAHASSADLVSWIEHPLALSPGEGDDGCWSGSILGEGDDATLFYTAVSQPDLGVGHVRVARPVDGSWEAWVKGRVVVEAPTDLSVLHFRDPFVRPEDDVGWRMVVGAGLHGGTAAALTYTSSDLETWSYDGVLAARATGELSGTWTGSVWECPQLLVVDGEDVLVVSVWEDEILHHVACARGTLAGGRFTAVTWQRLTYGGYYAATSFTDSDGRPGLLHWVRGVGGEGWTGALSVPHRLAVRDGLVVAEPHPWLERRRSLVLADALDIGTGAGVDLPSAHVDVVVDLDANGALRLRMQADRTMLVEVEADATALTLISASGTVELPLDRPLRQLRLLVDGPMIEVFAGTAGTAVLPLAGISGRSTLLVDGRDGGSARLSAWVVEGSPPVPRPDHLVQPEAGRHAPTVGPGVGSADAAL